MFLSMTPLKVGLQVKSVARVRDDNPEKSTNGLLLVCNRASIVCGKTIVLPDSALCLEAWFHDLVDSFTVDISVYTQAEGKLRLSTALSDNR